MSWKGECKKCGKCCSHDIKWIGFTLVTQKEEASEWAKARGYKIIQTGKGVIQANFKCRCPNLTDENLCAVYSERPRWCSYWPNKVDEFAKELGLDVKLIMFKGCGYEWVDD